MQLKTQITFIVGLAVAIWVGTLWFYGYEITWEIVKPFGTAISAVTFIAVFFEKIAWKWPLINGVIVNRPPIGGTWKSVLTSSYKDENGLNFEKHVYLVINQTLRTLSVRMYTDKARSFSISESIVDPDRDELYQLAVVYQNVPHIVERQISTDSHIHFGALHLSDIVRSPKSLTGPYWTDRGTFGQLHCYERRSRRISSYIEGQELFADPKFYWWRIRSYFEWFRQKFR